ncbi:MAG: hypothetical protein K9G64_03850 [Bacteroidia bacterium]|nr:hypothetical protein [Bacteroidia bacterium]
MTDKELDNLVKQKLAQQQFEYHDAYWQKAAALIDADRANSNKLVWVKYAFYMGAIGVFTLMSWFLLSNTKTNIYNQKAENVIENQNIVQPNNIVEKKSNAHSNVISAPSLLKSTIETNQIKAAIAQRSNSNNSENQTNAENNFVVINKKIDSEEYKIFNAENEEIDLISNKSFQLLGFELTNPVFDFKNINFIKSPENFHKNSKVSTYLNASFEVGTNSFNNTFSSNSFGYYIGGRIYFDIGKVSFNSNLHFENINQDLAARTYTNKNYDFNSITAITTIKNKSIDYAIIGLNAMYPVYKNNSLGIGIQYAQIVQTNDLMSIYNVENNSKTNQNTNNYSSVLNKTDWQFTFNYQNRFAKHLAVNASYVFGLNDITNNQVLLNNKIDNNSGFKLGLQYIIK